RHQAAALELAELARVGIRDPFDDQPLPRPGLAECPIADGPDLAAKGRDGVTVRVELGLAEELEDALLHSLRDHVLEAFGLIVDLVPGVAEDPDEEHLEQAVMAHQLQGDLTALAGQLLPAVAVVLDQALGSQPADHLADAWRGDAESPGELAGRHRSLGSTQQVQGFEVVLLGAGEAAAALECRRTYHKR